MNSSEASSNRRLHPSHFREGIEKIMNRIETAISNLDVNFYNVDSINAIKDHLSAQETHARNAGWSKEDLETLIMSESDVTDSYSITEEKLLDVVRDIQHDIISEYAAAEYLEHSTKVDNAHSLDRVVEIINTEESSLPVDQVAGYYAFQAALENAKINGIEFIGALDDLEPHLDVLRDAGANFDWANAMQFAQTYSEQHIASE